jgi:glycosyltransferase involved in cell wall biosynthesis
MKSVLMIAYGFPPEGNAGVYRPLRFVRHLPSLGWQPTVITLETDFFERYDPSLLSQVPKEIEVIRVKNRDPWQTFLAKRNQRVYTQFSEGSAAQVARILSAHQNPIRSRTRELVRSIEARVYHPDIAMGWIAPAVKATQQFCKRNRPDVIWATAGPVSSFHVAEQASRRTGVPYVLDFRDAWTITFNEFEERRPHWARQRDRRNMFRLLRGAQAVIFRYDTEAECYWRAYHCALEASKIRIIPNGFEGEVEPFNASRGEKCKFLYTGTLSDYRYDTLLEAIGFLKRSSPEEAAQLHFHFVGEGTRTIEDQARNLGLTEIITAEAAMSQNAVIQLSKQADALLLLGRPPTMKGYELFAAAKLFGYLKAGRPIVGILPPDEAKRILQRAGASTVADVDSKADIVAVLRRVLRNWADGTLRSLLPDTNACRTYSAESQTRALVAALEGAPASDPFIPGRVDIPDSLREEISRREEISWKESSPGRQRTKKYSTGAKVKTVIAVPKSHNS